MSCIVYCTVLDHATAILSALHGLPFLTIQSTLLTTVIPWIGSTVLVLSTFVCLAWQLFALNWRTTNSSARLPSPAEEGVIRLTVLLMFALGGSVVLPARTSRRGTTSSAIRYTYCIVLLYYRTSTTVQNSLVLFHTLLSGPYCCTTLRDTIYGAIPQYFYCTVLHWATLGNAETAASLYCGLPRARQ